MFHWQQGRSLSSIDRAFVSSSRICPTCVAENHYISSLTENVGNDKPFLGGLGGIEALYLTSGDKCYITSDKMP